MTTRMQMLNVFGFNKNKKKEDDDDDNLDEDLSDDVDDGEEYEDDEDEDDEDEEDEDEKEEEYDSEGFGDEEDRKKLLKMSKADRMVILHDRLEQRKVQQRRAREYRRIQQSKKEKATKRGKTSSKEKALAKFKRDRDAVQRKAATTKKQAADDASDQGVEEGRKSKQAKEPEEPKEEYKEAPREELEKIRLGRDTLLRWLKEPFADELLPGFYVRVQLPNRPGKPVEYTIARVTSFVPCPAYTVQGHSGKVEKVVSLKNPASERERKFQITHVSNSPFTELEFNAFNRRCREVGERPPSVAECTAKVADLVRAESWEYTESDVLQMATVAPLREQTNLLLEKRDLEKLVQAVASERVMTGRDDPKYQALTARLELYQSQLDRINTRLDELSNIVKPVRGMNVTEKLGLAELRRQRERPRNVVFRDPNGEDTAARRATMPAPLWVEREEEETATPAPTPAAEPIRAEERQQRVSLREALQGVDLNAWFSKLKDSGSPHEQPRPLRPLRRSEKRDKPDEQTKIGDNVLTLAEWERSKSRQRT